MTDDESSHDEPRTVVVGGPVDRISVTLALYGEDLVPDEVTGLLGCSPTHGHRRGEQRRSRSANVGPWKQGAWLLTVDGEAPKTASELLADLLGRVPDDESLWSSISDRWQVSVGFGLFLDAWNRSLVIDAALIQRLARMRVALDFDIYADTDDDAP